VRGGNSSALLREPTMKIAPTASALAAAIDRLRALPSSAGGGPGE
jgi:hypothetical protein